jgi:hypothetical protein
MGGVQWNTGRNARGRYQSPLRIAASRALVPRVEAARITRRTSSGVRHLAATALRLEGFEQDRQNSSIAFIGPAITRPGARHSRGTQKLSLLLLEVATQRTQPAVPFDSGAIAPSGGLTFPTLVHNSPIGTPMQRL